MQKLGFVYAGPSYSSLEDDQKGEFAIIRKKFIRYGYVSSLNSLFKFKNRGTPPKMITRRVWKFLQYVKQSFVSNNELAAKLGIPLEGVHEINYIYSHSGGVGGKGPEWAIKQIDKVLHKYNSKILTNSEAASVFDDYW